jgi:CRISPR-associated protein Csm3
MAQLIKKIIYSGTLKCLTGIHIGDSKESADIGGVDSPVVRRKDNGQPYIPGSSLKGKMRCLLEQVHGINGDSKFKNEGHPIQALFGATENKGKHDSVPSRIIVRDSFMEKTSAKIFLGLKTTDMPYTEVKFENSINRIKGTADSPRQIERVPAGAIFEVEFIINIFDNSDENQFKELLAMGVNLLNHDYLGGSGSRGYGHIKISLNEPTELIFETIQSPS